MSLFSDLTSEEERIEHLALKIAPDSTISFPITASPSKLLEDFKLRLSLTSSFPLNFPSISA
jgi:hypothetical protein